VIQEDNNARRGKSEKGFWLFLVVLDLTLFPHNNKEKSEKKKITTAISNPNKTERSVAVCY